MSDQITMTDDGYATQARKSEQEFAAEWSALIDKHLPGLANCYELVWRGPDFVRVYRTEPVEDNGTYCSDERWVQINKTGYNSREYKPETGEIIDTFVEYKPSEYGHEFEFEWVDSDSANVNVGFYDGGDIWDANVFDAGNGDHLSPMSLMLYTAWAMREATRLLVTHYPDIEIAGSYFPAVEAGL